MFKSRPQTAAAPSESQLPTQLLEPSTLHESVAFLARYLGTTAHLDRLREALGVHSGPPDVETLRAILADAGMAATPLSPRQRSKASVLPALVFGADGRSLALLAQRDGRWECQQPGIDGSSWLSAEEIEREVPGAHWLAVRQRLFFDQRSALYALPQHAQWFWGVFRRNRWIFYWALIGTVALNVFGALIPFYSMAVYDRVVPNNALNSLWVLTSGVAVLIMFEFVMKLLRSHLLETASRRMDVALSGSVFAQTLKMRADNRPASGGVLANTVRDFESVRDFFTTSTLTMIGDLPFMFFYLAVIALVGGKLAFVPLLAMPILLGVGWWARRPLGELIGRTMRESTQRTAHLFETMNGLDTVKALGAEAWSRRKWEGLTQAIAHNNVETRELTAKVNYLNAAVMAVANVAVVGTGAWMMSEGALTMGQLIAVTMLAGRALAPINQIASLIVRWEQTKLSYEALDKIMAAPTDEQPDALQAPKLSGRIELRDVTFGYPQQPPVLEKVQLAIRPGERVGIIGKLGSGKSTVLKLVLNQFEPKTGSVLLDNIVNTHMEPLSMRRQIGYVPQDVTLFHGSLRENIELGRAVGDDQALVDAMRTACLDEVVTQLPQGIATQVGERGERLSGGQRQTVAIARALLTRPRLLLLDEPSSMVDPATEQRLIERLRALQDTTIVLVTHRMAMLALVDRLIVMDRGRIVADGPRDDVLRALAAQRQGDDPRAAAGRVAAQPVARPAGPAPATVVVPPHPKVGATSGTAPPIAPAATTVRAGFAAAAPGSANVVPLPQNLPTMAMPGTGAGPTVRGGGAAGIQGA